MHYSLYIHMICCIGYTISCRVAATPLESLLLMENVLEELHNSPSLRDVKSSDLHKEEPKQEKESLSKAQVALLNKLIKSLTEYTIDVEIINYLPRFKTKSGVIDFFGGRKVGGILLSSSSDGQFSQYKKEDAMLLIYCNTLLEQFRQAVQNARVSGKKIDQNYPWSVVEE